MERVLDPTVVASLLSLVVSIRNKLTALGFSQVRFFSPPFRDHLTLPLVQVPKDPFAEPMFFLQAVVAFKVSFYL